MSTGIRLLHRYKQVHAGATFNYNSYSTVRTIMDKEMSSSNVTIRAFVIFIKGSKVATLVCDIHNHC